MSRMHSLNSTNYYYRLIIVVKEFEQKGILFTCGLHEGFEGDPNG